MSPIEHPFCTECQAILRELRAVSLRPGLEGAGPLDLVRWFRDNQQEIVQLREKSPLIWRRFHEHYVLTGHRVFTFPLPPRGMFNPN
jgi:hypothetical protein